MLLATLLQKRCLIQSPLASECIYCNAFMIPNRNLTANGGRVVFGVLSGNLDVIVVLSDVFNALLFKHE